MFIGASEIELEETHAGHGLQVNVRYFTLPGENFAALVRQATVRSLIRPGRPPQSLLFFRWMGCA